MSECLIKVENLSKKFCRKLKRSLWYGVKDIGAELIGLDRSNRGLRKDEFWALREVSFEIQRGELLGIIGPNGAGKTTLLKLLSGLIKPDRGSIIINGKIQALIALGAGFNPILTGRENIFVNGAILGMSKKDLDSQLDEIIDFSEIGKFIDMPVQSYSSGMKVRLGFAIAVNLKPDILIVDEVLAVGDAAFRRKARQKMMKLLYSGISVIFVSHNMPLVASLTSRCIYLESGKVLTIGPSDEVISLYLQHSINKGVIEDHLGEGNYMCMAYIAVPDSFILKEVKVLNDSNEETQTFRTFDNIKLSFKIEFKNKISHVSFAIAVRDQVSDIDIAISKTTPGKPEYYGSLEIECLISKNILREGVYNIGFYVADLNGGALYKSHNVKSFTILADMKIIENSGSSLGHVVLDTSWKIGASL